jgi:uncharacterized repeat protein (TIGR02543 family)
MKKIIILTLLLTSCSNSINTSQYNEINYFEPTYNLILIDSDGSPLRIDSYKYDQVIIFPNYYKQDYDFLGWYLPYSNLLNNKLNMPNYDLTLQAKWTKNKIIVKNEFIQIINSYNVNNVKKPFIAKTEGEYNYRTFVEIDNNDYIKIKFESTRGDKYVYMTNLITTQFQYGNLKDSRIYMTEKLINYNVTIKSINLEVYNVEEVKKDFYYVYNYNYLVKNDSFYKDDLDALYLYIDANLIRIINQIVDKLIKDYNLEEAKHFFND